MNFPLPPNVPPPPMVTPKTQAEVKRRINVRSKGQRGERGVIELLQPIVDKARAQCQLQPLVLQRNTLQAHLGGHDIVGFDGFSLEVKFQETGYNPAWWRQCLAQANKCNAVPILLYRKSRVPWTVKFRAYVNTPHDRDQIEIDITTSLEDFIQWFSEAYNEACSRQMLGLRTTV